MTSTIQPAAVEYDIFEVSASTSYSDTRDYGSHPAPLDYTEEFELPVLLAQKVPEAIPSGEEWLKWGRWRKQKTSPAWHFYASDVKFASLLRDPGLLTDTGAVFAAEVNCSSFEDDPLPVALAAMWRKRCISRFWQDQGVNVFIDLNVAGWSREVMFDGVPTDHELFCTRYMKTDLSGDQAGVDLLYEDYEAVVNHVDDDADVLFAVYGGGKKLGELCAENGWLWLPPYNHKAKD